MQYQKSQSVNAIKIMRKTMTGMTAAIRRKMTTLNQYGKADNGTTVPGTTITNTLTATLMIKMLTVTWTMMMTITMKMVATKITKKAKPITTTTTAG